jgi:SAM-dependent MidA family methyltransferase
LAEYFARLGIQPAGEAEVNLDAMDLMETVYSRLTAGRILTIDYGYEAADLFAGHPQGTFMTYHHHATNGNPYENIGSKDMTSHVDFTSLMLLGEAHGFRTVEFTTQADFLARQGFGDLMLQAQRAATLEGHIEVRQAAITLLNPAGMGGFRVLVQER